MSIMKLTINTRRPVTVYDTNGKRYKLMTGTNVLNLEYKDYAALSKSLGLTVQPDPDKVKVEPAVIKQSVTEEIAAPNENIPAVEEPSESDNNDADKSLPTDTMAPSEEPAEIKEPVKEESATEEVIETKEPVKEEPAEIKEPVDYTTWSYTKLKNEYKSITGKNCKLKKEEVIKFLQEQSNA